MIAIKGGTFQMWSYDSNSEIPIIFGSALTGLLNAGDYEKPIHSVSVSDYYLGKTVITQALWKVVMGNNPSHFKGDNLQVEMVSWNDTQEFIKKLNSLTRKNYKLPTEAEWEYAAGGGASVRTKWAGTDSESSLGNYAWYYINSSSKTHAVATMQANTLGLYDMSGNVWEWCSNWYGNYSGNSQTNPAGPTSGSGRVFRGGSWRDFARGCRVALRYNYSPDYRGYDLDFRVALVP